MEENKVQQQRKPKRIILFGNHSIWESPNKFLQQEQFRSGFGNHGIKKKPERQKLVQKKLNIEFNL